MTGTSAIGAAEALPGRTGTRKAARTGGTAAIRTIRTWTVGTGIAGTGTIRTSEHGAGAALEVWTLWSRGSLCPDSFGTLRSTERRGSGGAISAAFGTAEAAFAARGAILRGPSAIPCGEAAASTIGKRRT
jgi:hypothetical protein